MTGNCYSVIVSKDAFNAELISLEIYTGDEKEYCIRPITGRGPDREVLTFDVKCKNDAHVALLGHEEIASPIIEIFIGGWNNTKSAIRVNQAKPDKAEEATPDIVSPDEYRRFWIRFRDHVIQVGRQDEAVPILVWENDEPFEITHYAFTTGWGSSGSWIFDEGTTFLKPKIIIRFTIHSQRCDRQVRLRLRRTTMQKKFAKVQISILIKVTRLITILKKKKKRREKAFLPTPRSVAGREGRPYANAHRFGWQ